MNEKEGKATVHDGDNHLCSFTSILSRLAAGLLNYAKHMPRFFGQNYFNDIVCYTVA